MVLGGDGPGDLSKAWRQNIINKFKSFLQSRPATHKPKKTFRPEMLQKQLATVAHCSAGVRVWWLGTLHTRRWMSKTRVRTPFATMCLDGDVGLYYVRGSDAHEAHALTILARLGHPA